MDIETAIDRLYRLALGEFIGARNECAKALRKDDKAAAARVKELVKPSLSAWAVNQLYWHQRPAYDVMVDAGKRVRAAQQGLVTGDIADNLQDAILDQRGAVNGLVKAAELILMNGGHGTGQATMRKIRQSLESLAGYGDDPPAPGPGRLVEDVTAQGFDAFALLAASLPKVEVTAASAKPSLLTAIPDLPPPPLPVVTDEAEDEKRRVALEAALASAKRTARDADRELTDAESRARESERHLLDAQREREAAERALAAARERVNQAAQALETAERWMNGASTRVADARERAAAAGAKVAAAKRALG